VVNGDNITATYGTTATADSPATTYPITPTLVDPNGLLVNYNVSSTNGTLTVTKAPLAVTANDASRAYGATNPIFTATVTGLMNNDPISPVFTTTATSNSPAGGYPITITGFQDPQNKLPNYTVSTIPGTLTIVAPIQSPTMQPLLHPGSGAVVITWTAVSNATYRVQYETGLKPSAWADLSPNVTATGATASYTDNSGAAGQRFYRILVVQ
jgi:hypothetical protein